MHVHFLRTLLCLLIMVPALASAQRVVNRYPYIQSPTETSVTIAWRTHKAEPSHLVYGTGEDQLTDTLISADLTQKHVFTLTDLTPDTKYYYQAGKKGLYKSKVEHFYTAKPDSLHSFRFLHYGDCGYDNHIQNELSGLMEKETVDFAIVSGDVDQGNGDAYDKVFFKVYKKMLARDCHYTALGNHDCYKDGGQTFLDDFYLPANNPAQNERYYTFKWGNAKFICLDSNIDYLPGSDQYKWLESELANRDRDWIMVFFHHPPWTNSWDKSYLIPLQFYYRYQGNTDMRTTLVPLFEQYQVDFVLNGHAHSYQRGTLNGVNYVISGGAGAKRLDKHRNDFAPNIQFEEYANHFVRFEINGSTAIYEAVNIKGDVIDHVEVRKATPSANPAGVRQPSEPASSGEK